MQPRLGASTGGVLVYYNACVMAVCDVIFAGLQCSSAYFAAVLTVLNYNKRLNKIYSVVCGIQTDPICTTTAWMMIKYQPQAVEQCSPGVLQCNQ